MRLMPAAATNAASDPDVAELRDCLLRLTRALLPWMISSYGSIRSMAQQAVRVAAVLNGAAIGVR